MNLGQCGSYHQQEMIAALNCYIAKAVRSNIRSQYIHMPGCACSLLNEDVIILLSASNQCISAYNSLKDGLNECLS